MEEAVDKTEQIREWFKKDPSRMAMVASRHFGVTEGVVVKALIGQWPITPLRADAFREIMDALKEMGTVRIFVRSRNAVMECDGQLGEANYSNTGPFFNIDGGGIDMHIIWREISAIYALEKQSHQTPEDKTYSLQFFDKEGDAVFKVFLWEQFPKIPAEVLEKYNSLVERLTIREEAAV